MADYSKVRIIGTYGLPETIDLSASGNFFLADNFKIGSASVTASKPLKLNASKEFTSGDIDLTSEVTGELPDSNLAQITTANKVAGTAIQLSGDNTIVNDTGLEVGTNLTDTNIDAAASITLSKLAALTGNRALVSDASGVISPSSVTDTELGYLSGVSGSIQTQINSKVSKAGDTMSGDLAMGGNKISGLGTPTANADATTKQYVDQLAITGGIVKEAVLVEGQMDDTQGILAAEVVYFNTNPVATDTIVITDGTNTETYTFVASESSAFDVAIGATPADTMTNLAQAINDDSSYWSGTFSTDGLDSINTDGVVTVFEKTAGASVLSRIYGTWGTQTNCKVVEFNGETQYTTEKTAIDLPSSDPAAARFGFNRQNASLVNGEIHLILDTDVLKSWNGDAGAWLTLSGSGSLPDATAGSGGATKGKVTIDSDKGLDVISGVLESKVDDTTIGFDGSGQHYVKDNAIDGAKLVNDAVSGVHISDDAVDSEHIVDGAIDNIHLAGGIATSKLADASKFLLNDTSNSISDTVRYTYSTAQTFSNDGDLVTKKYVDDSVAATTPEILEYESVSAGTVFSANRTYAVRWALDGELAGTVYPADKDEEGSPAEHFAIGIIQTTAQVEVGEPVTVIKKGKSIALKSNDTNVQSTANGKPVFLQNAGAITDIDPKTGVTAGNKYASVILAMVQAYNATVTNTLIEVDAGIGGHQGIDLA